MPEKDKSGAVNSIRAMASNSVARLYGGKKPVVGKGQEERSTTAPAARPPTVDDGAHTARTPEPRRVTSEEDTGPAPDDSMEVVSDAAEATPEARPRPSAKAFMVAIGAMIAVAVVVTRACSSDPTTKVESATKAGDSQWKKMDPIEARPLAAIDPKTVPGLAAGIDRERQLSQQVDSISRPLEIPVPIKAVPPPAIAPENAKLQELQQKVQDLTAALDASRKEVESVKKLRPAKTAVKKSVPKLPSVKIMAIARTERCQTCPMLALIDVDGVAQQVGSGDQVKGYTVSVAADRVVLSRNKEQHVFYSLTPPQ